MIKVRTWDFELVTFRCNFGLRVDAGIVNTLGDTGFSESVFLMKTI
jgi:hypothetical protein